MSERYFPYFDIPPEEWSILGFFKFQSRQDNFNIQLSDPEVANFWNTVPHQKPSASDAKESNSEEESDVEDDSNIKRVLFHPEQPNQDLFPWFKKLQDLRIELEGSDRLLWRKIADTCPPVPGRPFSEYHPEKFLEPE